jgi:glucokinase
VTAFAVDIGGTKIAAARVGDDGTIDGKVIVQPTPADAGSEAVLTRATDALRHLDAHGVDVIGISSAGVISSETGTVLDATASIRGWAGTDLAGRFRDALGLPAFAIGDGHAFAVGEATYGVAAGHGAVLVLAIGTGVGGSFVRHKVPMQGSHSAAGHFGHVPVAQADGLSCYCGKIGHLEAIGSGAGMVRWYHQQGGSSAVTSAMELFARAADDASAVAAITISAEAVGAAAAGLANAFDPDLVVVAGGVTQAGPRWEEPMRSGFAASIIPVLKDLPLVISNAGEWLALRGAARHAQRTGKKP